VPRPAHRAQLRAAGHVHHPRQLRPRGGHQDVHASAVGGRQTGEKGECKTRAQGRSVRSVSAEAGLDSHRRRDDARGRRPHMPMSARSPLVCPYATVHSGRRARRETGWQPRRYRAATTNAHSVSRSPAPLRECSPDGPYGTPSLRTRPDVRRSRWRFLLRDAHNGASVRVTPCSGGEPTGHTRVARVLPCGPRTVRSTIHPNPAPRTLSTKTSTTERAASRPPISRGRRSRCARPAGTARPGSR